MIKNIRLKLEYNTYCIWLYDENDEVIDNDNPPEWDDENITNTFMTISNLYDSFYFDNDKDFRHVGVCPNEETRVKLKGSSLMQLKS